jgi:hypothetical protein
MDIGERLATHCGVKPYMRPIYEGAQRIFRGFAATSLMVRAVRGIAG